MIFLPPSKLYIFPLFHPIPPHPSRHHFNNLIIHENALELYLLGRERARIVNLGGEKIVTCLRRITR